MNDDEAKAHEALKSEIGFLCENGARAAVMMNSGSPVAAMLSKSLLEDLTVLYRRGVGKMLAEERRLFSLELAAQVEKHNQRTKEMMEKQGPRLWGEWHRHAMEVEGRGTKVEGEQPSPSDDSEWLKGFVAQIPCGECKTHFEGLLRVHPPVWGDGYFEYTVMIHNLVNQKIGKAMVTAEEARQIWSKEGG